MDESATGATVNGRTIPERPNLPRLRAERFARLQDELASQDLDGLVLVEHQCGLPTRPVSRCPVTTAAGPACSGRSSSWRRGDGAPHVYTAARDGLPPELPPDHVHGPLFPDLDDGAEEMVQALSDHFPARCATGRRRPDTRHAAAPRGLRAGGTGAPLWPRRSCARPRTSSPASARAQRISELAMVSAREALRPGVRQNDLSAVFLRRAFELGASAGCIDPIWQVMPPWKEQGPWTSHGDLAYPTPTTDRFLPRGRRDLGRCGHPVAGLRIGLRADLDHQCPPHPEPPPARAVPRWRDVVDAVLEVLAARRHRHGARARAATEANDGVRPWIEHFYLAHGVGTDSAEMPLVGTDLGPQFDDSQIMEPGMVVVIEPVIWDDGAGGYRCRGHRCRHRHRLGAARAVRPTTLSACGDDTRDPEPRRSRGDHGPRGLGTRRLRAAPQGASRAPLRRVGGRGDRRTRARSARRTCATPREPANSGGQEVRLSARSAWWSGRRSGCTSCRCGTRECRPRSTTTTSTR